MGDRFKLYHYRPVRMAAEIAIRQRLERLKLAVQEPAVSVVSEEEREIVGTLIWCLPLVDRLRRQGRGDHQGMINEIMRVLVLVRYRPELQAGIESSSDRTVRLLAFGLLTKTVDGEIIQILDEVFKSSDPVIRVLAAGELRNRLSGEVWERALEKMLQDRFMPVRREGVYGIVEKRGAGYEERLWDALLDRHVSIRELGRFYLRKLKGENDFLSFYRESLMRADVPKEVGIAGLGETGSSPDAGVVEEFLLSPNPRIRRVAIQALSRLDKDGHDAEIIAALQDESPGVAKMACRIVLGRRHILSSNQLW